MSAKRIVSLVAAVLAVSPAFAQDDGGTLADAVTSGEATVALRARYEHVDQDNVTEKADALPVRLRLNYRTGQWNGWSAFGELDYVAHALIRDFNSGGGTSPNRSQYPTVADPKGGDLNQLYLDYAATDQTRLRFGRQRILLDNQRFVGGVGWRQNEQTYDGLTLTTTAIPNTSLQYSYVTFVRRIFGESVPAGRDDVDTHLLNAKVTLTDAWTIVPYVYFLDYDDASRAANSSMTLGARLAGSIPAGDGKMSIVGEFARQSDAADSPLSYDANYVHADFSWALNNGLTLGLGFESLGSDNLVGFSTPLATGHKFQGWADQFLSTPSTGVDDVYATVKYKAGAWNLTGVYHDFSAESGSGDYGDELDVSAGRPFGGSYGILFKAAFFSGDNPSIPDVTKIWIQLTASY